MGELSAVAEIDDIVPAVEAAEAADNA